jgi:small subunit ribosomal protein S20
LKKNYHIIVFKNNLITFARSKKEYNFYKNMANHKSSLKRIRQSESRQLENKYFARTTRNAVKKLRSTTAKAEATEQYPKVVAMLDKLAKKNVIHLNKASNLKSKLALHINSLS